METRGASQTWLVYEFQMIFGQHELAWDKFWPVAWFENKDTKLLKLEGSCLVLKAHHLWQARYGHQSYGAL